MAILSVDDLGLGVKMVLLLYKAVGLQLGLVNTCSSATLAGNIIILSRRVRLYQLST